MQTEQKFPRFWVARFTCSARAIDRLNKTMTFRLHGTAPTQQSYYSTTAGVVRKRLKLKLSSKKLDGGRVYQIAGGDLGKPGPRQSKRPVL
jgi:hypothetical protein